MKVLVIGCGRRRFTNDEDEFIYLDADGDLDPDIICVLGKEHIPLPENSIDTVVAVHVLEHIGKQGETAEWFDFWEDLYRVLRPDGTVQFESPRHDSVWAWADPGHTRALSPESFIFLAQDNYRVEQSAISPFRIKCDFIPKAFTMAGEHNFRGELTAVKPLVPWWEDAQQIIPRDVALIEGAHV